MNRYNPNIHHRRSIRLQGYDYAQAGLYFITICCQDRACRFGEVVNGEMILNEYGQIAHHEWMKTPDIRPNVELGEFIVMPNHVHGIIRILGRGESHSPDEMGIITPYKNAGESHSPDEMGIITPYKNAGESHSPDEMGIIDIHITPDNAGVCKTHNDAGVCKTHNDASVCKTHNDAGVCKTHNDAGVCKTPLLRSPSQTVGAIVRGYKSSVTKQMGLIGFTEKLWQRNYYEHIIRNEQSYQNISEYILNNPAKWAGGKSNK